MKRKAHWIRKTHLFQPDEYLCSECGALHSRPYESCFSCGAGMGCMKYDPSWVVEAEMLSAILDDDW